MYSFLRWSHYWGGTGRKYATGHTTSKAVSHPLLVFLHLCFIFVPAYLVDRTYFGSNVLWVDCCPYPFTGSLSWLQGLTTLESISSISRNLRITFISPLGPHSILDLWHILSIHTHTHTHTHWFPFSLLWFFYIWYTPCSVPFPISFPIKVPSSIHFQISILFLLLKNIQPSSLGSFILLGFLGSVDYSVVILYFMTNIHL